MRVALFGLFALLAIWVWVFWDLQPRTKALEEQMEELKARVAELEEAAGD